MLGGKLEAGLKLPVTYHVVVAFDRDEEGDLKPGPNAGLARSHSNTRAPWRSLAVSGASCRERGGCDDHILSDGRFHFSPFLLRRRSRFVQSVAGFLLECPAGFVGIRTNADNTEL